MPDDLRIRLGKSQVEEKNTWTAPWPPEVWAAGLKAIASGKKRPPLRFPVIVGPGTSIPSPADLKELAGMASVPEVMTTTTVPFDPDDETHRQETVKICEVSCEEKRYMQDRTTWGKIAVLVRGGKRFAIVVCSLEPNGHVQIPEPRLTDVMKKTVIGTDEDGGGDGKGEEEPRK
ncbi:hypothetical protein F4778DRAFT_344327 [Xylariomycetidae sp. FL2044]|nr:hypothetical protein F4778DRAFT_344327 [Xylariomycetidae sp. FL2044]